MIKYNIHQPSVSDQTKLDKPMRPLNVLLVHQDRSFVTWFENEFAKIFTLRVMSNPENAINQIKNGYRPHIIIGDVRYGKSNGLEFFLQVKYLCTEGVRVIFSKSLTAKDMDTFNEMTAVHRFIKLPRPGTDIHYQLRLLIEQFIPLQRSSTSLQALLFPNGAPQRVRRGSDFLDSNEDMSFLNDEQSPNEISKENDSQESPKKTHRRSRVIQQRSVISSAVEPLSMGSTHTEGKLEELLNDVFAENDAECSDTQHHEQGLDDNYNADASNSLGGTNPSSTTFEEAVMINSEKSAASEEMGKSDETEDPRAMLHGTAPLRSLLRLLSGTPPEMHRFHLNNHAHGVADIAVALATVMNLSEDQIDIIRLAALLHDCGKYGMDDRILAYTPDMLSEMDRQRYASHVERGRVLLAGITGLEFVSKIVAQHHERYDGSGFPDQLEGPQILLESQIIHIADEYHNRVYRLPNFSRMTTVSRSRETTLSGVAIAYRQSQALSMIQSQKHRYAPVVRKAFTDLTHAGICDLVRPGTEHNGSDTTLVDDLAKKYSAGPDTIVKS